MKIACGAKGLITFWGVLAVLLIGAPHLLADVGIIAYQSKGSEARRTGAGHIAIIATDLCADSFTDLRACRPGEAPGAVIHHYPEIASGYSKSTIVVPLLDHLVATRDPNKIPVITSGGTLEAMQIEYWRRYLRPYFPPLSPQEYDSMRTEARRFNAGRLFRQVISLDFIGVLLEAHSKHYPTEPFAIPDPVTGELIPDGRWREVIGVSHQRSLVMIVARTRPEQEQRLIDYVRTANEKPFNSLSNNCSDFVKGGLLAVFSISGMTFHPRYTNFANAWVSTPIEVATGFVHYIERNHRPAEVAFVPMLAGTRRPSLWVTSLSRGALVPNPDQGKLSFGIKTFINILNPLLMTSALAADTASHFTNLEKLVHERSGEQLSRLANELAESPHEKHDLLPQIQRTQIRIFGTSSCWSRKQEQFRAITAAAESDGLLRRIDAGSLLKRGRPFLLARQYEKDALALHQGGNLMAVIEPGLPAGVGIQMASLRPGATSPLATAQPCLSTVCPRDLEMGFLPAASASAQHNGAWHPETVPGREAIRSMADSGVRQLQSSAFRLMATLLNYELTSDPTDRETTEHFDHDWQLFLETAARNGIDPGPEQTSVEECSSLEYDKGASRTDDFGESMKTPAYLLHQLRAIVYSPVK